MGEYVKRGPDRKKKKERKGPLISLSCCSIWLMTGSHPDLHHLITLICHEGKCKKNKNKKKISVPAAPFLLCVKKKKKWGEAEQSVWRLAHSQEHPALPLFSTHCSQLSVFTPGGGARATACVSAGCRGSESRCSHSTPGTFSQAFPAPGGPLLCDSSYDRSNLIRDPRIEAPRPLAGPLCG